MAAGTKLVLGFENSDGKSITMSYSYFKPSTSVTTVKALMNGIIANGEIFASVPAVMKSAKTVITSENIYDLSA